MASWSLNMTRIWLTVFIFLHTLSEMSRGKDILEEMFLGYMAL
jgi:hypothetical protein